MSNVCTTCGFLKEHCASLVEERLRELAGYRVLRGVSDTEMDCGICHKPRSSTKAVICRGGEVGARGNLSGFNACDLCPACFAKFYAMHYPELVALELMRE